MRFFAKIFLLISFHAAIAMAQMKDPTIQWQRVETENFTIVFDARHYSLAQTYAQHAERSFSLVTPAFGLWPRKTVLVIDDSSDIANGFATGFPYPMISLFPVLPSPLDSISDYGNWGLELVTHEYAHILTFEPALGVMRPARWIFGNIVRPNILLPRWYTEGLAVELETRLSRHGRLRSANYLSIIRSMAEEGTLRKEDISRINETAIPDWPGGVRPYLMGALLWNEITSREGEKAIGTLNLAYSKRIPFFINGPAKSLLGVDYQELLDSVYSRVEKNAFLQLELIRAAGQSQDRKILQKGLFNHSPVISPNGKKLAYISRDHNVDSEIVMMERDSDTASFFDSQSKKIADGESIGRVSWFPNSESIVFDSVATFERYYSFSDLYVYDLEKKKKTQITKGLRARDPAVSPDGRFIVFAQNLPGSMRLVAIRSDGTMLSVLHQPSAQTRVSRPEFLNNQKLVFTEKLDDGAEVLRILRLQETQDGKLQAAGSPEDILESLRPVHFPRITSEGLLVVSDRSGVANLYLIDQDLRSAKALTNTTSRIMTGEIDPLTGELIYSRLTASGPQIHFKNKSEWMKAPQDPPIVGPLVENQWPEREKSQELSIEANAQDYSALPYLLPRYWLPFVYFIPNGTYVQASTGSTDPADQHSYSVVGAYDSLTNKPSFAASYLNRTTGVPLNILLEDINEFIYSGGFVRRSTSAILSGSFFLPHLSNNWRGSLGGQSLDTDLSGDKFRRNGVQTSISYTNASQKGLEITPERGASFSLGHSKFIGHWGDVDYEQTEFRSALYFSRWLPTRHAFALFANASVAPRLPNLLLGQNSVAGNFQTGLSRSSFLMRGYGSGVFLGRNIISGTLEYRFPISYYYQGFGTTPFFIRRFHGSAFVDAITLDGAAYSITKQSYEKTRLGSAFYGTGLELKADTTLFYHIPVQFTFGAYFGADRRYNPDGWTPFVGIGF